VTRRHSAINSLRASATIIVVLRAPFGPSVRMRYHRASALSFWNIRKRHANWISLWGARGGISTNLLSGEVFRSMASEMLLRSQRKLHHAFQELVRRQADEVVHDELLGV